MNAHNPTITPVTTADSISMWRPEIFARRQRSIMADWEMDMCELVLSLTDDGTQKVETSGPMPRVDCNVPFIL